MTKDDVNTIEPDGELLLEELEAVAGGDQQVAHLPQSIHVDYTRLSIDQNPTRLA